MNGRASVDYFSPGGPAAAARPVTDWRRLLAALLASFLLHGIIVFLPDLGSSSMAPRLAPRAPQKPGQPPSLDVRLEEAALAPAVAGPPVVPPTVRGSPGLQKPAAEAKPAVPPSRGLDVLPFRAQDFRTTDQLTKRPRPATRPNLDVPEIASVFTSGKVILKVWIDALGEVVAVDVESSEVPDAVAASAARVFRQQRFVPGELGGRQVASLMRIEVTYIDGKSAPPREAARR